MSLALWRSPLARALHQNRSLVYARYAQLATVRLDGRPANRTVVFRGFLEPTNQLKFVVDARSEKIGQISHQPWAELCWYFPQTREQFRLLGRLTLVQGGEQVGDEQMGGEQVNSELDWVKARQLQWQALSDAARLQFAWPAPRQPKAAVEAFQPPLPDPVQPLPNFCLLLLDPVQVDHLELRSDPQNRHSYQYQVDRDAWQMEAINP